MTPDDQPAPDSLSEQLPRLLAAVDAAGRAVLPHSNDALLRSIVETATTIFGAGGASILLVNEQEEVLEFMVTHGGGDAELEGRNFPLDQGIAGYVAMTGQPLTISDVEQDARFNRDMAERIGYIPQSILAVPLVSGEKVIGVLEILDKQGGDPFGLEDLAVADIFARQAAIAIHQFRQYEQMGAAIVGSVESFFRQETGDTEGEAPAAAADDAIVADLVALAQLFNAISALGVSERQACLEILRTFAGYARSKHTAYQRRSFTF